MREIAKRMDPWEKVNIIEADRMTLFGLIKSILGAEYKMFLIQAKQEYDQAMAYDTIEAQHDDKAHVNPDPEAFDILLWSLKMDKHKNLNTLIRDS